MQALTTFAAVQNWLSDGDTPPADAPAVAGTTGPLARLIGSVSGAVLAHLQRDSLASLPRVVTFGGHDGRKRFLPDFPVTSVASVMIDGRTVSPSVAGSSGWLLDLWSGYPPGGQQSVQLVDGSFRRGTLNCSISYQAGYLIQNEAAVAAAKVQVAQPLGTWILGNGVAYANSGAFLTPVTGAPAPGQYQVGLFPNQPGSYVFNAADFGAAVLISYSFVPAAVEESVIELVGERYKMRSRIGLVSESMGGQSTQSYDRQDIPAYIKTQLLPFKRVLPV